MYVCMHGYMHVCTYLCIYDSVQEAEMFSLFEITDKGTHLLIYSIFIYSYTHILISSFTHILIYSYTHILIYSYTHMLM